VFAFLTNEPAGILLEVGGLRNEQPRHVLMLSPLLRHCYHLAENRWPCTIGWLAFVLSEVTLFPHMAQAFALNAQRWQYFLPCSVFVLHVSQELE